MDRAEIMRRVPSKNTKPEITVRSMLHRFGYRYSLHRKDLPGKPDIVFGSRRAIIFVHGCWWHRHNCKRGMRVPTVNQDYWVKKITRNQERDKITFRKLKDQGWKIFTVWECSIQQEEAIQKGLLKFLK